MTEAYCRAVAVAFGVPIYYSWKEGGFKREMLRQDMPTARTIGETPSGNIQSGGNGPDGTRLKFPQVSANLSVRWCSAYLKIDVAASVLRTDPRFEDSKTLFITGERAEESSARARYAEIEVHRADRRNGRKGRHIDHWRPVHGWSEKQIWKLIETYRVNPHPAYWLGFGRTSCLSCIFGSPNQWATVQRIDPDRIERIAYYEDRFDCTIHRTDTIQDRVAKGTAYRVDDRYAAIAMQDYYDEPVFLDDWKLPAGAFGESCGPT